ncbi:TPA: hypothetical protein ACN1I1_001900 [Klebsiella pneumoniae]|uniref:hypothetical protein n=1 Tax=Klebsiella TaxID=570 RepID=UPI0007CD287F|nr:hypothetical protein [Klebsiella pneumoniae]MCD5634148.1 hypothetical protein [Klebsiella pneumoniae]MCD5644578.1 hypothetical protein [Klebsiella pneumoniae]MCD5661619.1 hypothetical protein [Klebsiella pneumoniae]MCD5702766.1 hypothetical protein [Klebsiella pneumoniae]MCD5717880.1 hypothetical protein [Klebsiella pneumoniae]
MTDITELAQSLKAAADREMIYRDVAETSEIWERTVTPENILALVEALEKAQQQMTESENRVRKQNRHICELFDDNTALRKRIAELESRTVKLPKPHAHLIWIQAGHAPDDYWDDVEVSHSEKDRCCDGSERYPVYARWEIEEMLAAAGIKVEAER